MSTGLIIGKFLPPHRGHLHLIEYARARVDHLTVLICSLKSEPIPGDRRFRWLSELCPGVDVQHLTDENPSYPHEHPDFWTIWVASIRQFLPTGPDVVFTSEDYGDELSRRLGARHDLCDPERRAVPVSGSAVRENPYAHWDYLPPPVRAYYTRKVAFAGAESTGKSTLSLALATHLRTAWLPEYGRLYVEQVRSVEDQHDMDNIARGQAQLEDQGLLKANRVLICDTDLLATLIWNQRYFDHYPAWMNDLYEARRSHLYLLCDMDLPWIDDGYRDSGSEARRRWFHQRFLEEFEARGLSYVFIQGEAEQRFALALQALHAHFPQAMAAPKISD